MPLIVEINILGKRTSDGKRWRRIGGIGPRIGLRRLETHLRWRDYIIDGNRYEILSEVYYSDNPCIRYYSPLGDFVDLRWVTTGESVGDPYSPTFARVLTRF